MKDKNIFPQELIINPDEQNNVLPEWTQDNNEEMLEIIKFQSEFVLQKLYSLNGNYLWASDSPNFIDTFFGRDTSTAVANLAKQDKYREQCCVWQVSLAQQQGEGFSTTSDERDGAIPHEIRSLIMDEQPVSVTAAKLFNVLRPRWSEDPETDTIVYYGELDGPARFIRACTALARNGVDLSSVHYIHKSGETRNLNDACERALGYIQDRCDESDLSLVELQPPENEESLTNQTLKDSKPAYLHNVNGKPVLPNRSAPRAPLEAQLLSYEAMVEYSNLLESSSPVMAADLLSKAALLKDRVMKHFVVRIENSENPQNQQPFLAAMIDRDPISGELRQLNTHMSDAAEGLDGQFFKGDDPIIRELRQSITRTIMSKDFLTDGGIRCRALKDNGLFDFAEYHGSLTNWHVITHVVAKGLLEQGFPRLASELWTRMLGTMIACGRFQEFCYIDENGSLLLPDKHSSEAADWVLRAEEHPQDNQAWSITAAIEAVSIMLDLEDKYPDTIDFDFEDEILSTISQFRHQPQQLIDTIRQNVKIYSLDQMHQLAGAHEVDINSVGEGKQILRRVA